VGHAVKSEQAQLALADAQRGDRRIVDDSRQLHDHGIRYAQRESQADADRRGRRKNGHVLSGSKTFQGFEGACHTGLKGFPGLPLALVAALDPGAHNQDVAAAPMAMYMAACSSGTSRSISS